jgi:hypothetical protein
MKIVHHLRGANAVEQFFQLRLQVAISFENVVSEAGELRSTAVLSTGGFPHEGPWPAAVHLIQNGPRLSIADSQSPGGFRERASGGDLVQKIGAQVVDRGSAVHFNPDAAEP